MYTFIPEDSVKGSLIEFECTFNMAPSGRADLFPVSNVFFAIEQVKPDLNLKQRILLCRYVHPNKQQQVFLDLKILITTIFQSYNFPLINGMFK